MPVRPAELRDAASLARVHVDSWRTTYAGILPDEFLAGLSYGDRERFWEQVLKTARPTVGNFLAQTESGQVIGMAAGGPERTGHENYRGELYLVYLLEQYQRMGWGRRLVSAVAHSLVTNGFDSMLLWVARDNHPACRFYEALGGEPISSRTIDIAGTDVVEVAYGWQHVAGLVTDRAGGQPAD